RSNAVERSLNQRMPAVVAIRLADAVAIVVIAGADGEWRRMSVVIIKIELDLNARGDGNIEDFSMLGEPGVGPPADIADAGWRRTADSSNRLSIFGRRESERM